MSFLKIGIIFVSFQWTGTSPDSQDNSSNSRSSYLLCKDTWEGKIDVQWQQSVVPPVNHLLGLPDAPQPVHFPPKLCHQAEQSYLGTPLTGVLAAALRYQWKPQAHSSSGDLDGCMFPWDLCLGSCIGLSGCQYHWGCRGHSSLLGGHHCLSCLQEDYEWGKAVWLMRPQSPRVLVYFSR